MSLTQVTVESSTVDAEQRRQAHEDLSVAFGDFIETTGWHPRATARVAGALAYTRYNWFVRWLMKRIARTQGASTDTSRDHVHTDWDALERFVIDFVEGLDRARDASDAQDEANAGG